ncbi:hypothetical protein BURPS305_2799 [Burkholderia pseudomallei 305]|nr:hypothetical protein GBP346_A1092 [Burkholderia pseudomallei MSHR346]EBA47463.1 hypothetical protein BURPS305_2799 [Burkholderia pseudomallei 305]
MNDPVLRRARRLGVRAFGAGRHPVMRSVAKRARRRVTRAAAAFTAHYTLLAQ